MTYKETCKKGVKAAKYLYVQAQVLTSESCMIKTMSEPLVERSVK